ncbi:MAG TPA: hypothetical protein VGD21_04695 [Lysobacter sp.]
MHPGLSCCVLALASAMAVAGGPPSPGALSPSAPAQAAPVVMDRATIEKAVAGSVVGALADRFGGRAVEAKFGAFEVRTVDGRQRSIRGEGGMRFAGDSGWIGFRFHSVYDSLLGQAGPPEVELGVGGDSRPVPNDGVALRQLEDRVADMLRQQTGMGDVRMQLDRVDTLEMGQHYLVMQAQGLADFGRDGSSRLRVHAIYDRRDGQWLQLEPALGATARDTPDTAFVER